MFLQIMVGQNPKTCLKKLQFFISYDVMLKYIYTS
jgi:hypothetical protein